MTQASVRSILSGPHISTLIEDDGASFVMTEPLQFVPIHMLWSDQGPRQTAAAISSPHAPEPA